MKKFLIIAIVGTMLFGVAACTKKDDNTTSTPAATPTKTDLLIAKKWKLTALTVDGADFYAIMDACDQDDLRIFKAGGVYNADNGPTKCDPADDQIFIISTWALSDNDTKLTFDGDTFTINELTATSMKLTITEGGNTGVLTLAGQ